MNPALVRHLVLPVHERLIGRRTLRYWRELEQTQWWTDRRIARLQNKKLRALLRHADRHVPYHAQRFRRLGVDPCTDDPRQILQKLPTLTKREIHDHVHEMIWPEAPGGLHRYATGGSTGQPLRFYFDRRRQAYDQAARMRTHRWFGVDVGQPEVYLWGSPLELNRQDRLRKIRDRFVNHLLLSAFELSKKNIDRYLDRIERYQPAALFGYPSSIAHLVRYAQRKGRKLSLPELQAVFVTGETICRADRSAIRDYFNVPVADGYGSREAGFIAHECPDGTMHVTDENVICEILDSHGSPARPGQTGEIVITHLDAYAMPFIRYRTGDMARAADGRPCACGRGLSRIEAVAGRKTDFLVSSDGTMRHALSLIYILREMPGIEQFTIHQRRNRDIDLLVAGSADLDGNGIDRLRRRIMQRMGPGLHVRIRRVPRIDPADSGKHRHVISEAAALDPVC